MESSIVREVDVYWRSELAGRIVQTARDSTFAYVESFGATGLPGDGIAFHLPRSASRFITAGTFQHPFFANLLPEGYRFNALRSRLKASADDALALLVEVGSDCIGDVSIVPVGQAPRSIPSAFESKDVSELDLRALLERDLLANESIPGVQEKLSDQMISFPAKIGSRAAIVKLNPSAYPNLIRNEHFFMRMAAACGIRVAECELLVDRAGNDALLVRRFDRTEGGRLHQEDACQLLDVYPGAKYNVSMREVARTVAEFGTGGPVQLRRLLELVAFSYMIGNGDLHAKNISLLRSPRGLIELSPAYDLLSTLPYKELDQKMALKVEGKDSNLKRAFLTRFFVSLGLPERACGSVLDRICQTSLPWFDRLDEIGWDEKSTARLRGLIVERRRHLAES